MVMETISVHINKEFDSGGHKYTTSRITRASGWSQNHRSAIQLGLLGLLGNNRRPCLGDMSPRPGDEGFSGRRKGAQAMGDSAGNAKGAVAAAGGALVADADGGYLLYGYTNLPHMVRIPSDDVVFFSKIVVDAVSQFVGGPLRLWSPQYAPSVVSSSTSSP